MFTKPKVYFRIVKKVADGTTGTSNFLDVMYGTDSLDAQFNTNQNARKETAAKAFYLPYNLQEKQYTKRSRKRVENGVLGVIRERYGKGVGTLSIGSVFANSKTVLFSNPPRILKPRDFADSLERFFDYFDNLNDPAEAKVYDKDNQWEMEFVDEVDLRILVIEHGTVNIQEHSASPNVIRWNVQADVIEDRLSREYKPLPDSLLDKLSSFSLPNFEDLPVLGAVAGAMNQTNAIIGNVGKCVSVLASYKDLPNKIIKKAVAIQSNTAMQWARLEQLAGVERREKAKDEGTNSNENDDQTSSSENSEANQRVVLTSEEYSANVQAQKNALDAIEAELTSFDTPSTDVSMSEITTDQTIQNIATESGFSLDSLSMINLEESMFDKLHEISQQDTLFLTVEQKSALQKEAYQISEQIKFTSSDDFSGALSWLSNTLKDDDTAGIYSFTVDDTVISSDITIKHLAKRVNASVADLIAINSLISPYVSLRYQITSEKTADIIGATVPKDGRLLKYTDENIHSGTLSMDPGRIVLITNDAHELDELLQYKTIIDRSYADSKEIYLADPVPFKVTNDFRVEIYYPTTNKILGLGDKMKVPFKDNG